jgi:hypothetical protein
MYFVHWFFVMCFRHKFPTMAGMSKQQQPADKAEFNHGQYEATLAYAANLKAEYEAAMVVDEDARRMTAADGLLQLTCQQASLPMLLQSALGPPWTFEQQLQWQQQQLALQLQQYAQPAPAPVLWAPQQLESQQTLQQLPTGLLPEEPVPTHQLPRTTTLQPTFKRPSSDYLPPAKKINLTPTFGTPLTITAIGSNNINGAAAAKSAKWQSPAAASGWDTSSREFGYLAPPSTSSVSPDFASLDVSLHVLNASGKKVVVKQRNRKVPGFDKAVHTKQLSVLQKEMLVAAENAVRIIVIEYHYTFEFLGH